MARRTESAWLAGALAGAAGVHAVVAGAHAGADTIHSTFFVVLAGLQLALAMALVVDPRRSWLRASILVNTATLLVWALSRTVGLPGQSPEPVAGADLAAAGLEFAAVVLALRLLGSRLQPAVPPGFGPISPSEPRSWWPERWPRP